MAQELDERPRRRTRRGVMPANIIDMNMPVTMSVENRVLRARL